MWNHIHIFGQRRVIYNQPSILSIAFFWRVRKIAKSDCQLRHVCLSVRPHAKFSSHRTDYHGVWLLFFFLENLLIIPSVFKIWQEKRVLYIKSYVELVRNLVAHGDGREGKWRGNWRMEWVASTLTPRPNMVNPALLKLMRTPRLPAFDWTDAPTYLNGLVRCGERRNLVPARVPSRSARAIQRY